MQELPDLNIPQVECSGQRQVLHAPWRCPKAVLSFSKLPAAILASVLHPLREASCCEQIA